MLWPAALGLWGCTFLCSIDQLLDVPCSVWWYILQITIDLWLISVSFRCSMLLFQCRIQEV
jgi:hypothetical protein